MYWWDDGHPHAPYNSGPHDIEHSHAEDAQWITYRDPYMLAWITSFVLLRTGENPIEQMA